MNDDVRQNNRFDILRLLAALLVLWSHCFPLAGRGDQEPLARWTGLDTMGGLGVAIFFVLSGYLVMLSWERRPQLRAFARNRAVRIFPALLVLCALSVFILGPIHTRLPLEDYFSHEMTWRYWRNATAWTVAYPLPGVFETLPVPHAINGSLWSLPYEIRCYVALVALAAVAPKRWPLRWKALAVLLVLSVMWLTRPPALGPFERLGGLDAYHLKLGIFFAVGASLAAWRERWTPRWWWVALLVVLAAALPAGPARLWAVWLAVSVAVLCLALHALWLPRWPARWGDWSYGCYLYGFPIQQWLVAEGWHQHHFGGFVWLSTALTLLAGALSWRLIESRALRWRAR